MNNYDLMAEILAGRGPVAAAKKILSNLPAGEVGEEEVFLPVTIDGRLALVFPERSYWLETDGSVSAATGTGHLIFTTRFRNGLEIGVPPTRTN